MMPKSQMLVEAFIETLGEDIKEATGLGLSIEAVVASFLVYASSLAQSELMMDSPEFLEIVASSWNDRAQRTGATTIHFSRDEEERIEPEESLDKKSDDEGESN